MKVFVTGVNGQLGHDVINELNARGEETVASDVTDAYSGIADNSAVTKAPYEKLDITDADAVSTLIKNISPDVIVHCAAWTAVDMAEEDDLSEKVRSVNEGGTKNLALAAKEAGAKIIYLSTDYVFDGKGETPWNPDSTDYAPLNFYGQTKLLGEQAIRETLDEHFIVRISWVYGLNGKNFVKTMLSVGKNHDEVRVVNDQIGLPTYTKDLSVLLCDMAKTDKYGTYHACNEGDFISWYDFTVEIYRQAGMTTKVTPVSTEEYGLSKAARPSNSRLDRSKLKANGFNLLPDWKDALSRYFEELKENGEEV